MLENVGVGAWRREDGRSVYRGNGARLPAEQSGGVVGVSWVGQ
jgi:hypothetical protein